MGKLKPIIHHPNKTNKDIIIIGEKCHRNEEKEMIEHLMKQTQKYKEELEKVRAENTENNVRSRYYKEKLEEARTENIDLRSRNTGLKNYIKEKLEETRTENIDLRNRNTGLKNYIRELETKNERLKEAPKRLQEENTSLRLMLRLEVEMEREEN